MAPFMASLGRVAPDRSASDCAGRPHV